MTVLPPVKSWTLGGLIPKSSVGTGTVRLSEKHSSSLWFCERSAGGRQRGQKKDTRLEWPQCGGWVSHCWVLRRGSGQEQGPCIPSKAFLIFITTFFIFSISFEPFLKFPSLYLYYPSILMCCLFFAMGSSYIDHSYFTFIIWAFQSLCYIWIWSSCLLYIFRLSSCVLACLLFFLEETWTWCIK